ncbi:P35 lipoprotein homolog reported as gene for P38 lipoprotein [Malacoplasma penetrans HF-2]|uniref:P35 lipoprotein homolog reported as gene for P38 lipoprotein n=2 Tax=Malacoplasma penetrans TaxID=28227 RepID=Q8EV88_MALP2|nr:P35 family lipoprotein [Malacoplasma penetrans]BAC44470.1 P35 lipoprotein homolog reported as gene for P38 lipoprotein [Malacoplasma penetrans HF-2]
MKIKKIKLLKALALTGAFGIVATVPIIVSSCSSTDNGGSGNNTGGNGNQGDGGGSGNTDQQENKTVKPELKDNVELNGKLSTIYGTDSKTTNELISEDIKANPENYFTNGSELKDVINQSTVTVDGGFSASQWTEGSDYTTWSAVTGVVKVTYPAAAPQIDIASLNALKQETFKDDTTIQAFLTAANLSFSNTSSFTVENKLGLTNGDLLHVNIKANRTAANGGNLNLDLQIPVSNINLKTILKVSVSATNNSTGTNIEAVSDLTTNFSYNIGIDSTLNFTQTGTAPTATTAEANNATEVLKKLGYQTGNNLDNDKISAALGIYNCKFTPKSATEKQGATAGLGGNKVYTVVVDAAPYDSNYVWDDGSTDTKEFSFDVSLTVN